MEHILFCNQTNCDNPASFRFTWPGRNEAGICATCAPKMQAVANFMGMHIQLIPLSEDDKPKIWIPSVRI